ncbi:MULTISPECIES: PAS domain S-box protein [unclassified Prosthecochloris]|uniref:hybrid sensor histidine kinase/response regulator n=1 Tax=unclassified Prosthecochloris TaxID=2632826 RepID=UPI00223DC26B|nr:MULTISPECIES: PAS domain S-box protein [unclassified Prosthecochloris]UZJ39577.1 PAS domain S-box protein [Prosthecochloris sp. SCSIO W1102]
MRDEKQTLSLQFAELEALRLKVAQLESASSIGKISTKKLRESEERFRQLFENISSGVAVYEVLDNGNDFIFRDFNKSAEKIDNIEKEKVVGKSVLQLFPGVKEFGLFEVFQRVWRTGQPEHHPVSMYEDNRIVGWRKNYIFKLPDGDIVAVYDDVTREKQFEEKLKTINKAIEQSPAAVVITDREGSIEYVNPKFTALTGYTFEEVSGKNPRILQSGEMLQDFYEQLWQTIISGEEWRGEFLNKKKDGRLYWEDASISPVINEHGGITNFVAVKEDITEKKKLWLQLIEAKEKAEESDRLKSCFLANISHEIRTPMNGILGFSRLLREPLLSGEEKEQYIELIHESGKRMLSIINNLIDISRIETGELSLYPGKTSVNEIIEKIHADFFEQAQGKCISFSAEAGLSAKESLIITDKVRLSQVLSHLVGNALKYTHEGEVAFGYKKDDGMLEFYVRDTGIGIPDDQQGKIFEHFRQVSLDATREYEGAGLGLSLSKKLVEMLGGTIRVDSAPGKGSTFFFTIPYDSLLVSNAQLRIDMQEDGNSSFLSGLAVLVVDDDSISRLLLKGILSSRKVNVILAKNGKEAVEKVQKVPGIRIVLMDMKMPVMNGYEATSRIKEIRPELPVIAQTAFADPEEKEVAKEAGCDVVLSKPINSSELLAEIQRYV